MIVRRLLWTNIFMAGSAAGWTILALHALALPADGILIALTFVLTLGFYTRDRIDLKEIEADLLNIPERTAWVQRHLNWLRGVALASLGGSLALILARPIALFPLLIGVGFALSYTIRWLPWRGRRVGWKHLPILKMPFVAVLWALITVITPATVYHRLNQKDTWLITGAVAVLIMIQILINDIRDLPGDRTSGTLSLPVLLGVSTSRRVGYGLAILGGLLAWPVAPVPILVTAAYSALLLQCYRRENDSFWRGWIEAQGIVPALPIVLLSLA